MSILDNIGNTIEVNPAEMAATHCKIHAQQVFLSLVEAYNHGIRAFWQAGVDPQAIADELGADAKEIFLLHYKLGQLIASEKPEIIADALVAIGNFTLNEDGTVTITETPQPE